MFRGRYTALVCTLLVGSGASIWAQSLADVARKEEDRRKSIPEPAKVYTNRDLRPMPAPAAEAKPDEKTAQGKAAEKGAAERDAAAKDAAASGKDATGKDAAEEEPRAAAEPVKDKAHWASRLKALQAQLARDETYVAALQSRINALTTDFVNRDDPAQRSVIERDRVRALAELDHLKQTLPNDKKAIDNLLEEARRAGVPPGWLR